MTLETLLEHLDGIRRTPGGEQRRAKRLAHGVVPPRRLHVGQGILNVHRHSELARGALRIPFVVRDASAHHVARDTHHVRRRDPPGEQHGEVRILADGGNSRRLGLRRS